MPRDDFASDIKLVLARRVGVRCSNPNCRQPTSGPQDNPAKATNVGVAAHISAAARGGARYNQDLKPVDRKSIENAIWLCQNCAKLIDNDFKRYTVDLLRQWKRLSEEAARLAIDSPSPKEPARVSDQDLVRFYAQCFDRPAFQDQFMQEGSMEAFDKAIEDTITAINTGSLRSRDGVVLTSSRGKAFLQNPEWRDQMDVIVDLLRAIRSRYQNAIRLNQLHVNEGSKDLTYYCIHDPALAEWMDTTRAQVIEIFGQVAQAASVHAPRFPRPRRRHW
jgi:hypothetical protein